jgi:HAD superfamily hydrolase (TIGR01509 family)
MSTKRAFLFDLNGTMIHDMPFHLDTWHDILNNTLGASLSREEVKNQMYGKNQELLVRVFGTERFTAQEMNQISMQKEIRYQQLYRPHLKLIEGLQHLLESAKNNNVLMAIGSAAIGFNIDFVLDNLNIRHYFSCIISADDVKKSKPHPETYLMAAEALGIDPVDCIVFEDAPKGIESAANAGMPAVVLTTMHDRKEFAAYNNILAFAKDYTDPIFMDLIQHQALNN